MPVRLSDVVTAIAVLIQTCTVLVFFAGLGALILASFGIIPAPY
jgi:hypothetical protein